MTSKEERDLLKTVQGILLAVKGNGVGLQERVKSLEDNSISTETCEGTRDSIHKDLKRLEKKLDNRNSFGRWVFEMIIRAAPWVMVLLILLGVIGGRT